MSDTAHPSLQPQPSSHDSDGQRERERQEVIAHIRQLTTRYGLGAVDIFGGIKAVTVQPRRKTAVRPQNPATFRNPITGQTWTGKGRRPRWIEQALAAGEELTRFKITS